MDNTTFLGRTPQAAISALLCWSLFWTGTFAASRPARADTAPSAPAEGAVVRAEVFDHCIKYLGGPGFPDFRGHETWENKLELDGTKGTCTFAGDSLTPITFSLTDVTSIVYGQASSRHAGVWVSVGVILAPVALLGLLHKSRKHNVLVSWKGSDGHEGGVYLEVQPDHFRRLLNTLAYRTGKPIYADEKDRKWLMTQGVQAQLDPAETGGSH